MTGHITININAAGDLACSATLEQLRQRPIWTARCKSGFTFNGHECNRACARGELLCSDCATAVVVLPFYKASQLERLRWMLVDQLNTLYYRTSEVTR